MRISFSRNKANLIERIRSGDNKAMETIYFEYRDEFVGWSTRKFSINEDDALDHYQDVLTIFFEKIMNGDFTELESSIKTFLFGIGKNKIRQQFDKQTRRSQHLDQMKEHYQFLGEEDGANIFEKAYDVTMDALKSIGEPCLSILRLFYFEKKSMTEIAQTMGHKSEGVSRTTKKRCLEKIRNQVTQENDD